jgi:L-asparaginase/Glu-tRNA(Gln) amidotransferase subunit D
MLPRVLILYTGGTFGMDADLRYLASSKRSEVHLTVPELSPTLLEEKFLSQVPELKQLARWARRMALVCK